MEGKSYSILATTNVTMVWQVDVDIGDRQRAKVGTEQLSLINPLDESRLWLTQQIGDVWADPTLSHLHVFGKFIPGAHVDLS
jgi:hypothetical protein